MAAEGPFFSLSPFEAESYLKAFKVGHCNGNTNVLLVALDGADAKLKEDTDSSNLFRRTCSDLFRRTGAVYASSESEDSPKDIACAWYARDNWKIRTAAERICEVIEPVSVNERAAFLGVAVDELRAFQRVTIAEKNRISWDPKLPIGPFPGDVLDQLGELFGALVPFDHPNRVAKHFAVT